MPILPKRVILDHKRFPPAILNIAKTIKWIYANTWYLTMSDFNPSTLPPCFQISFFSHSFYNRWTVRKDLDLHPFFSLHFKNRSQKANPSLFFLDTTSKMFSTTSFWTFLEQFCSLVCRWFFILFYYFLFLNLFFFFFNFIHSFF